MVTAELAAALPALMLVVVLAVWLVAAAAAQARVEDAARELARAAARADPATGRALAALAAPGAVLSTARSGRIVRATARLTVHPMGGALPAVTVTGSAAAALEPVAGQP